MEKPRSIYALIDDGEIRYVGCSVDPADRFKAHIYLARSGARYYTSNWIRSVIAQNRMPELHILEENAADWREAERRWIAYLRSLDLRLTNVTDGGEGMVGFRHSKATKQLLSLITKHQPPEVRKRMVEGRRGKKWSEETRRRYEAGQMKSLRGRKLPPRSAEHAANISAAKLALGLKDSPETIVKKRLAWTAERRAERSISQLGKAMPISQRQNIARALKGRGTSDAHRAALSKATTLYYQTFRMARAMLVA